MFGHTPVEEFAYTADIYILTCFFKSWTAKEAYGKCIEFGISDTKELKISDIDKFVVQSGYIMSVFNMKYYSLKRRRLLLFISDSSNICELIVAFDKIMEKLRKLL